MSDASDNKARAWALDWRGVDDACPRCDGSGMTLYGSTSTWRGGVGGAMMTRDVCDLCWGSGDKYRHWVNLRSLRHEEEQRVAQKAATLLCDSVGAGFASSLLYIDEIVRTLEAFAKKRSTHFTTAALAESLAKALQRSYKTQIK